MAISRSLPEIINCRAGWISEEVGFPMRVRWIKTNK
jgi:hypothetical protein